MCIILVFSSAIIYISIRMYVAATRSPLYPQLIKRRPSSYAATVVRRRLKKSKTRIPKYFCVPVIRRLMNINIKITIIQ